MFEIKVVVDLQPDVKELLMKLVGSVPVEDREISVVSEPPKVAKESIEKKNEDYLQFQDLKDIAIRLRNSDVKTYEKILIKYTKDPTKKYSAVEPADWGKCIKEMTQAFKKLDTKKQVEEAQEIDYDALRKEAKQLGIKLVQAGKKVEVKELTAKYGATNIKNIADDKIEAYIEDLKGL